MSEAGLVAVQICTDYLSSCDAALARTKTQLVDRQLACMPIQSPEGQAYLGAMAAAANFAFANRSLIAKEVRQAFETTFGKSAREVRGSHLAVTKILSTILVNLVNQLGQGYLLAHLYTIHSKHTSCCDTGVTPMLELAPVAVQPMI